MTDEKKMQDLETKLFQYLTDDDVVFVKSLIKESRLDANLKKIHHSDYSKMVNRGIWNIFEKACREVGIEWNHSNEPEA